MSNILRHLFLWVLMLLPQLSWGQFIWHEDMGSPSVAGRVTLSYDTTSYVFDTVNAEEHSDTEAVWDDLNSQFEAAGITWAEIYELGKEESESYTVRLRMEVNTGYGDRYLNFGHNGAELVICQQGMPLPDSDDDPELRCRKNFCKFVILSLDLMGQNHDLLLELIEYYINKDRENVEGYFFNAPKGEQKGPENSEN